ncbi:RHS repeat domain-containing protein, partial [Alistipes putredinis]
MKKSYRPFAIPSSLAFVSVSGVVTADELHANNTGLKTYEKVAVLPDVLTDSTAYIERAFYYDKDGLLVQTVIRNHLGGINRLSNRYDDAGNQLISYESRATGPGVSPDILQTRMTYDDFGRVLTEQKRLGNGPIAKVSYRYDALGRVSTMIQGAGKINTSYKYDIAGRTTEQQNELFRMTLATDKPTLAGIPKNYAGQIGECSWSFAGDGYFTSYGYRYTPMGQLQDARTYRNGQLQVASYAEMDLKYDHNDNILSLTRYGNKRIVNDIQYVYDGNRLISTTDNGRTTTYGYDLNGNVISTPENACSYGYNYLNLVEEVRRNGSVSARYKYLADGTKLEVSDAMGCGFLYFGSLIYSKRGTIYTPESVGFTGGRIVCTSAGSEVQYHVTDYLGSVRVVADQNGRALEKINYYPFGKRWDAADLPISGNRYLFNGKEWQATGAVNL